MKKMKKLYDSKVFWLIVSFLLSLSVWVYVTSVETEEATKTFRGIPVEIEGEEALRSKHNLVITDVDTNTVTVTIRGTRRVVNALDDADLIARVDVSTLSLAGLTSRPFQIVYPSGTEQRNLTIVSRSQDNINFTVSKLTTQTVSVVGGFKGKAADGYIPLTPDFEPSYITISGPEVYVKNVDKAKVIFGEGMVLDSSYSVETGFTLVDSADQPVSTTDITWEPETIVASLEIQKMQDVKLGVEILPGAGATAADVRITVDPPSIVLSGDTSALSGLNQIFLDTIDLTSFGSVYEKTYPIPIPNGVTNLTGATEAKVKVEVIGLETRVLNVDNFTWTGLGDGIEVEVISQSIPVLLRGPSEVLSQLKPEDVRVEGDLTELRESSGNLIASVKVTVPGYPNVGAITTEEQPEYTVVIRLGRAKP